MPEKSKWLRASRRRVLLRYPIQQLYRVHEVQLSTMLGQMKDRESRGLIVRSATCLAVVACTAGSACQKRNDGVRIAQGDTARIGQCAVHCDGIFRNDKYSFAAFGVKCGDVGGAKWWGQGEEPVAEALEVGDCLRLATKPSTSSWVTEVYCLTEIEVESHVLFSRQYETKDSLVLYSVGSLTERGERRKR